MQTKPTETLANYIAEATFDDFPTEVVVKAKQCIQDAVGCALGGAQTDVGRRHIELARDFGGKPESTLIGDGTRISCVYAAHANTELTNVMDYDDMHWMTGTHPGGPIVNSALAVGEMLNVSGKDILTAVIVGYEVGLRIGLAIRSIVARPDGEKELLSNPSFLVFASVAAASKSLGLKAPEIVNAFGLVGSTPINRGHSRALLGGIGNHPYTDNKYDMGTYSLIGVLNSLRARKLRGPQGILDGDRYWTRCSANTCDHALLTKDLGKQYRIMEIAFKPVCFGAVVASPVTAVREALKGEKLNPQDIEEIKLVGVPKLLCYEWQTMIEAEFSTPCAVAMAVTGEEPGPSWYTSGRFKEPDILEIGSKVKFIEDPKARELAVERGQWVCTAEIKTKDGKVRKAHADYEKGAPENPLSEKEQFRKFMLNSQDILGPGRAEELWNALLHLETVENFSSVAPGLGKSS